MDRNTVRVTHPWSSVNGYPWLTFHQHLGWQLNDILVDNQHWADYWLSVDQESIEGQSSADCDVDRGYSPRVSINTRQRMPLNSTHDWFNCIGHKPSFFTALLLSPCSTKLDHVSAGFTLSAIWLLAHITHTTSLSARGTCFFSINLILEENVKYVPNKRGGGGLKYNRFQIYIWTAR